MPNNNKFTALALLAGLALCNTAQAALQGRDLDGNLATFEAYYDTDLNITWLADANYGAGSIYDDAPPPNEYVSTTTDGRMSWVNAITWVANLSFTDGVNVYDNWRLPTTLQPDESCGSNIGSNVYFGLGCTGSEMGHMFYSVLGGTAGQSILTSSDPDLAKFTNLQNWMYWSESVYAPYPAEHRWEFNMYDGSQFSDPRIYGWHAWAVSDGDVGIAAIPEPETYAMMLAGLGLVGFVVRSRKQAEV